MKQAWIVNAFTANGKGGNPAGVVFDDGTLSPERKLEIARVLGASETAFLSKPSERTFRFEFWTPTRQILDCGHATLGALGAWAQLKGLAQGAWSKILSDETSRELDIAGSTFWTSQPRSTFKTEDDLLVGDQGVRFGLRELPSLNALSEFQPDFGKIRETSERLNLIGLYLYVRTPNAPAVATTRMFAPRFGIPEESATGMAAGILASYLTETRHVNSPDFIIEQGVHSPTPSPSLIRVRAGEKKVWVGGETVIGRGIWLV